MDIMVEAFEQLFKDLANGCIYIISANIKSRDKIEKNSLAYLNRFYHVTFDDEDNVANLGIGFSMDCRITRHACLKCATKVESKDLLKKCEDSIRDYDSGIEILKCAEMKILCGTLIYNSKFLKCHLLKYEDLDPKCSPNHGFHPFGDVDSKTIKFYYSGILSDGRRNERNNGVSIIKLKCENCNHEALTVLFKQKIMEEFCIKVN